MNTRIQRRRTKGWRKPEGAVYVGRGSGFGNPWKVGSTGRTILPGGWTDKRPHEPLTAEQAVQSYINSYTYDIDRLLVVRERLVGRDLMCWCPVGQPCHADWLLLVANSPEPLESFLDTTPPPEPDATAGGAL